METQSVVPLRVRMFNRVVRPLLRVGVALGPVWLLGVPGRRSGAIRTTPVTPLTEGGERYIFGGFAAGDWVKNARAAGWGTLSRGRREERVALTEVPEGERAPILRAFAQRVSGARPFIPVPPDAPLEAFAAVAGRHPVFRVLPLDAPQSA